MPITDNFANPITYICFFSLSLLQLLPKTGATSTTTTTTPVTQQHHLQRPADFVHLVFFNHNSSDILLTSCWERLEDVHPKRFRVDHVLSAAEDDWTGRRGRVSQELVRSILQGWL